MDTVRSGTIDDFRFVPAKKEVQTSKPIVWAPVLISRAAIAAEVERLADLVLEAGDIRSTEIVHNLSGGANRGVTPGLAISINVVRPGETIELQRDNASRVEFCIAGEATAMIGHRRLSMRKWDAWTIPSMNRRQYRNEGKVNAVWLSYANTPLLDRMDIYYTDGKEGVPLPPMSERSDAERLYVRQNAPDHQILQDGARLRGYEFLTDIEVVENKALIWPWSETAKHLSLEAGDQRRNLFLLYNPATERRQGTTHSFFATFASFPAGTAQTMPERGHRHSSFAVNYHFKGEGASRVDGQSYEWSEGDLMLSAPSWSEHAHAATSKGAAVFNIQDHPFQIGIESLIWQEKVDGPILTLGSEPGPTGYIGPRLKGE